MIDYVPHWYHSASARKWIIKNALLIYYLKTVCPIVDMVMAAFTGSR